MRTVNTTTLATDAIKHIQTVLSPAYDNGAITQKEFAAKVFDNIYQETRSGVYQTWGYDMLIGKRVHMVGNNTHVVVDLHCVHGATFGFLKVRGGVKKVIRNVFDLKLALNMLVLTNDLDTHKSAMDFWPAAHKAADKHYASTASDVTTGSSAVHATTAA